MAKDVVTYQLASINGVPQNPQFDEQKIQELIKTFVTRDDDVFICTYVKSGTTWTQQIVNLLLNKGADPPKAYTEAIPWLEAATTGSILNDREATGWTIESISAAPGPRFFKTHANYKDLPRGSAKGLKIIYVARNPKDVVVSLYHHAKNKPDFNFKGTFSDMLDFFMAGTCENGNWFDHILEWYTASQQDPDHVMFLKYEDMLKEPKDAIERIARFTGLPSEPEIIDAVAVKSTIKAMRQDARTVQAVGFDHLRNGGSGTWRDMFTVRQSENFDALYRRRMDGTGLTFDFGEGCVM